MSSYAIVRSALYIHVVLSACMNEQTGLGLHYPGMWQKLFSHHSHQYIMGHTKQKDVSTYVQKNEDPNKKMKVLHIFQVHPIYPKYWDTNTSYHSCLKI